MGNFVCVCRNPEKKNICRLEKKAVKARTQRWVTYLSWTPSRSLRTEGMGETGKSPWSRLWTTECQISKTKPSGEKVEDSVVSEVSAETATSTTDWAEKMGRKPTQPMGRDLSVLLRAGSCL